MQLNHPRCITLMMKGTRMKINMTVHFIMRNTLIVFFKSLVSLGKKKQQQRNGQNL